MKGVSIYQWNVLAQSLAEFPHVDPEYLTWEHRWPLIEKRLKSVTNKCAIVVLEEVEEFMLEAFKKVLSNHSCTWKSKNPGKRDGTAIFWCDETYKKLDERVDALGTQNAVHVELVHIPSKIKFWVCGVHLKAKPPFVNKRVIQVYQSLNKYPMDVNVICVGDFNDVPESDCIKVVLKYEFKSVYPDHPMTTAKWRKEKIIRCIDYIWYRGPAWGKVLEVVDLGDLKDHLPSKEFPSDHLMLGATIEIK